MSEEKTICVNNRIDELIKRVEEEKHKTEAFCIKRLESLKTIDKILNDLKETVKHL
jgi:hypothetical protein